MKRFVLGIDVGGTNVKMGLINSSGKVFCRVIFSTKNFLKNKNELIRAVIFSSQNLLKNNKLSKKDILGIGMGLPGLVDTSRGLVYQLSNIPDWKMVPLKNIMEKTFKIPTCIDNDVNVIALGEWKFGAGQGVKNMICITLGTGVGGGLIINNELYRGDGFCAGEIGHIPLNERGPRCVGCGRFACLERYIGNRFLLKKAKKIFKNKEISLEKVGALALKGNRRAVQFWHEVGNHLGCGLAGVINLLNPRLVVIGGGVANNFKYFAKSVKATIGERAMSIPAQMVKIVPSKLGDDAGLIGSQVLVKSAIRG